MADRHFAVTRLPGFGPVAVAVFVVLYLPIVTLVIYSFNAGQSVTTWGGWSLGWYAKAWNNAAVQEATNCLRSTERISVPSACRGGGRRTSR